MTLLRDSFVKLTYPQPLVHLTHVNFHFHYKPWRKNRLCTAPQGRIDWDKLTLFKPASAVTLPRVVKSEQVNFYQLSWSSLILSSVYVPAVNDLLSLVYFFKASYWHLINIQWRGMGLRSMSLSSDSMISNRAKRWIRSSNLASNQKRLL